MAHDEAADNSPFLPLRPYPDQWRTSDGHLIQMCALHELDPNKIDHVAAITISRGVAVCEYCLHRIELFVSHDFTIDAVIKRAAEGRWLGERAEEVR